MSDTLPIDLDSAVIGIGRHLRAKVSVWFIGVLLAVLGLVTYVPAIPMSLVDFFYH